MSNMRMVALISLILALCLAGPAQESQAASQWRSFESGGVKIAYFSAGSGDPVVLIHGLYSSAEVNWERPGIVERLSSKYRVVALDVRGHGRSGKPTEESAYGLQMVNDVISLMNHLNIEKAHIVGYSMGSMIALKLIALSPERAASGTLGGMGWLQEGSALQSFWEGISGRKGSKTPTACVRSIARLALNEGEIKGIRIPIEVIVGDRDPVNRLYVEPLSEIRKDWQVVKIRDAGHLSCVVKPEFREELIKWLDGISARTSSM
jgi:pimeloyl-ACP methyl ester carboxylesterase